MTNTVSVNIIIPVLNGEKYIQRCIDSIRMLNAQFAELEIIVIDNGSDDKTVEILERLNVFYEVHRYKNISELRNIGVGLAKGEYIGFVDSDCLVKRDWLCESIRLLQNNDDIGIVGRFYLPGDNPTWVEKVWCERRRDVEGPVDFLPAGNMVMKKDLFISLGGFSNDVITGEDYEFCQRVRAAGYKVYSSKLVSVKHLGNMKRLRDVVRKERWYGMGMFSTLKLQHMSRPLISTIAFDIQVFAFILLVQYGRISLILLITLLLQLIICSIAFTKNVSNDRLKNVVLCVPIIACYLIGRSISVFDKLIYEINKRRCNV